jgi:hypothetical protein
MDKQQEQSLEKRFQTTMIGAIYAFEETFGYLWGYDKDDHELTESEKRFMIKWENTRNNILNNGNHQMRSAIKDLYKSSDKRQYNYKFYPRKNREDY